MFWKMRWTFIYVLMIVSVLPAFDDSGPSPNKTNDMPASIRRSGEIPPPDGIHVVHGNVCSHVCLDLPSLCSKYGSTALYMIGHPSDTGLNWFIEPLASDFGNNSFSEPLDLGNDVPIKEDDVGLMVMLRTTNYNIGKRLAEPVISGTSFLYRKLTDSLLPCMGDAFVDMFGIKHGDFGANVRIPNAVTQSYDDDKYAREIDRNFRNIGIVYDTLYVSTVLLFIVVVTAFCAKQEKRNKKKNKKRVIKSAPEPEEVKSISKSKRRRLKRQQKSKLQRLAQADADISEHEDNTANESDNEAVSRKDPEDVTNGKKGQEVIQVPKPAEKLTRRQKRNLREKAKLAKMAEEKKVEVEPASESEDDEEPELEVKLTKSQKRNLRRKRNAELMRAKLQDSE